LAIVYNLPAVGGRATADFIVASPLMKEGYRRLTMGIEDQLVRWVPPIPPELPASEAISTELLLTERSVSWIG